MNFDASVGGATGGAPPSDTLAGDPILDQVFGAEMRLLGHRSAGERGAGHRLRAPAAD